MPFKVKIDAFIMTFLLFRSEHICYNMILKIKSFNLTLGNIFI